MDPWITLTKIDKLLQSNFELDFIFFFNVIKLHFYVHKMASNDGDVVQKISIICIVKFNSGAIFYQHLDSLLEITGIYWSSAILSLNYTH